MRTGALIVKNSDGFALFFAVSARRWRRRDKASVWKRTSTNTASRLYQQERERERPRRPSVDPETMIRMLLVGYCQSIRSDRRLCREVEPNLA